MKKQIIKNLEHFYHIPLLVVDGVPADAGGLSFHQQHLFARA